MKSEKTLDDTACMDSMFTMSIHTPRRYILELLLIQSAHTLDTCTHCYLLYSKMQSSLFTVVGNIRISILSIHKGLYYFQMSFPNEEHKSHDSNYIVGDTESLGCEWWGGVRITF